MPGALSPLIRFATPDDGPAVRDFVFATLRSYGIEPDPEGLDADVMAFGLAEGGAAEFVADVDGRAVGSIQLSPGQDDGESHLSKFFVDAAVRGRGLGRLLLARAVQEGRVRGYRRIDLETRTAFLEACHLYEATGWQRGPDLPAGYGPDRTYFLTLE